MLSLIRPKWDELPSVSGKRCERKDWTTLFVNSSKAKFSEASPNNTWRSLAHSSLLSEPPPWLSVDSKRFSNNLELDGSFSTILSMECGFDCGSIGVASQSLDMRRPSQCRCEKAAIIAHANCERTVVCWKRPRTSIIFSRLQRIRPMARPCRPPTSNPTNDYFCPQKGPFYHPG